MRIGINALALAGQPGSGQSGIYRYCHELVRHLPAAVGEDDALFAYAGAKPADPDPRVTWRTAVGVGLHPGVRIGWERGALPLMARRDRLDLFHGTVNTLPQGLGMTQVVTIHDLAFLRWPDQVPQRRFQYLSRAVPDAARRAARVITPSEQTRRDVIDLLGVPADRVGVTPLGVDPRFQPMTPDERERFRAGRDLPRYILAVGNLEPRKNLPALIRAFAALEGEIEQHLVLAGAAAWRTEGIEAALADPRLRGRVIRTGFIPHADLPGWYAAADLFAMPSTYEGFGLPLLEALASGAPAVASDTSSLPEVAGGAAHLVSPDEEGIVTGIRRVLGDPGEQERLRSAGPVQAGSFTWARTAALTVENYREALR